MKNLAIILVLACVVGGCSNKSVFEPFCVGSFDEINYSNHFGVDQTPNMLKVYPTNREDFYIVFYDYRSIYLALPSDNMSDFDYRHTIYDFCIISKSGNKNVFSDTMYLSENENNIIELMYSEEDFILMMFFDGKEIELKFRCSGFNSIVNKINFDI